MAIYTCGDISTPYQSNEYRAALQARKERERHGKTAAFQLSNMKHTNKGDFTHLAPVGNLRSVIRG